jgi:hypothetical protein
VGDIVHIGMGVQCALGILSTGIDEGRMKLSFDQGYAYNNGLPVLVDSRSLKVQCSHGHLNQVFSCMPREVIMRITQQNNLHVTNTKQDPYDRHHFLDSIENWD